MDLAVLPAACLEMLGSAQVKEEDEDYESPLDILFDRLEMRDPDSIAVKQYHIYKQAAGKTAKSIQLIGIGQLGNLRQVKSCQTDTDTDQDGLGGLACRLLGDVRFCPGKRRG